MQKLQSRQQLIIPGLKADIVAYRIQYFSDDYLITGYYARPRVRGRYPCIIFNRGGNRSFATINEKVIRRTMATIASWGYVVIGSQYRGNDGGEGKEDFGGNDVHDIINLVPVLKSVVGADVKRMGMYGWSRGGMMVYRALTQMKNIRAAVIGTAITDLEKIGNDFDWSCSKAPITR